MSLTTDPWATVLRGGLARFQRHFRVPVPWERCPMAAQQLGGRGAGRAGGLRVVGQAGDIASGRGNAVTKDELRQWTRDNHVAFGKILADGWLVGVTRMLSTCRLWVGDTDGWSQAWDYPTMPEALAAAVYFLGEGDPMDGWVRHMRAGQPDRRRPCGDPAREYVADDTP